MGRPPHFALLRDHEPARRLAHRLEAADATTASEDRLALLRFWLGAGASRLRTEDHVLLAAWERHGGDRHPLNASIRDDFERLSKRVGAVASDPQVPAEELREIGREVLAHLSRQERELYGVIAHTLTVDELERLDGALDDLRSY